MLVGKRSQSEFGNPCLFCLGCETGHEPSGHKEKTSRDNHTQDRSRVTSHFPAGVLVFRKSLLAK